MRDDSSRFLELSAYFLESELFPRLAAAVRRLPEDDLWWKPNEASNSVGNLVLHLAGNVRQWVVHGAGGQPDVRDRDAEFAAEGGLGRDEVLGGLESAVSDAVETLRALDPEVLSRPLTIQSLEVTGMEAIYHVVEHFSMHTGQILYIIKLRLGEDLAFYRIGHGGDVERGWQTDP